MLNKISNIPLNPNGSGANNNPGAGASSPGDQNTPQLNKEKLKACLLTALAANDSSATKKNTNQKPLETMNQLLKKQTDALANCIKIQKQQLPDIFQRMAMNILKMIANQIEEQEQTDSVAGSDKLEDDLHFEAMACFTAIQQGNFSDEVRDIAQKNLEMITSKLTLEQ